jgi:hypothetical protein
MRQRRGRSPTPKTVEQVTNASHEDDDNDDHSPATNATELFLDEDDQAALVQTLQEDATRQARYFQTLFSWVCGFAILVSATYPWLCASTCLAHGDNDNDNNQGSDVTLEEQRLYYFLPRRHCWIHSLYSVTCHGLVIYLTVLLMSVPSLPLVRVGEEETPITSSNSNSNNKLQTSNHRPMTLLAAIVTFGPVALWRMKWWESSDKNVFYSSIVGEEEEHFHLGLMIGNIVTFLGLLVLRWDALSTRLALQELDAAQYKHKAL